MYELSALLILFALGLVGWGLFSLIRAPVPPLLGTLLVLGALRVAEVPIPHTPEFLDGFVQVALGIFIGTKVTRETVADLKNLLWPAVAIALWALMLVFLFGPLLGAVSVLDPVTAVLSSTVGGLPEMMVLSTATGADVAVVAVMKLVRALIIITVFPIFLQRVLLTSRTAATGTPAEYGGLSDALSEDPDQDQDQERDSGTGVTALMSSGLKSVSGELKKLGAYLADRPHRLVLTVAVALVGSLTLTELGVPAGMMVGAIIAVGGVSAFGLPVRRFPQKLFNPLLVLLGIMVSQHFGPDTGRTLAAGGLLWPLALSTVVIFATSLVTAFVIHRFVGWDLSLSLLAAAPGGFTVMTSLAVYYGQDPFRVSMTHLARLLTIKTVVPLVFTFLI